MTWRTTLTWAVAAALFLMLLNQMPSPGGKVNVGATLNEMIQGEPFAELVSSGRNHLKIRISGPMASGTDGGCEYFASFIKPLFVVNPNLVLHVDGKFVPSLHNPIDRAWAEELNAGSEK